MACRIPFVCLVFAAAAVLPAQQRGANDPMMARFVIDDLASFARALPAVLDARDAAARQALLQQGYIETGSPGLREFVRQGRLSAAGLAAAIEQTPEYYRWMASEYPKRLSILAPQLRGSLEAFKRLYPRARFPDIYFLVGQFRSSGTVADAGMLLGCEVFAVDHDTPVHEFTPARRGVAQPLALLRYNTIHELVHVQQQWRGKNTLLERAILEGTAELVASILVPGAPVPVNHEFATERHHEVWQRFTREMNGTDTSQWLANNQFATPDWPAAMAYNVGYHIARGFYESSKNKRAALQELFELKRPHSILEKSGYPR